MPRKILEQIIKQTSSHLMIKGTSAKWARTNLFPFPASHQSHRKERGHKGHVSWLSSTFDSVSDVIFIVSKLKREIYERVTQSLSENHSKSVSGSRRGGEMYQEQQGRLVPGLAPLSIVAGAAEGSREATLVCTPTPWGEMGINRGCNSEQGQVRMRRCCQAGTTDKSSWAIARLADGWAGSRRATPGSAVFLRQRQTPRWDVQTRIQLARRGQEPFFSTLQEQRCSWRLGSLRRSVPDRTRCGGSHGADRVPGDHHLWGQTICTAVVLPEEGKKSISMCGATKRKGIPLLSTCGAARKFLVSHWEIIVAGKGSEAGDRRQRWRLHHLHHCVPSKTNNLLEQCGYRLYIIIYIISNIFVWYI